MTEIIYTLTDGYGEVSEFTRGHGNKARIKINGAKDGVLYVGGAVFRVENGTATLDLSRLPDGDYTPLYVSEGGRTELEGIRRFGREILPLPTSEKLLRRLLVRVRTLEERLALAEGKIEELTERVSRKITF